MLDLVRHAEVGDRIADNELIAALLEDLCVCVTAKIRLELYDLDIVDVFPGDRVLVAEAARCGALIMCDDAEPFVAPPVRRMMGEDVGLLLVRPNLDAEINARLGRPAIPDTCPGLP